MNPGGIDAHWLWLIGAILLAMLELAAPGIFLVWFAGAAALTGIATYAFGLGAALQFLLFASLSLAAVYSAKRWFRLNPIQSSDPLLNERATRLVGRTVVVESEIRDGRGRVHVDDGVWNCRGPDCEAGERVRVVGSEGTSLRVEKADSDPSLTP